MEGNEHFSFELGTGKWALYPTGNPQSQMNPNGGMLDFARSSKMHLCASLPLLWLLSCLCFQRVRGAFESTGEGRVTPIWNSWGNVTREHKCDGKLCPDYVSLHFRKAVVEGRKGEAWNRPRLDFRWGGRKKRRPGCLAGTRPLRRGWPQPAPCECRVRIPEAPWWTTRSTAVGSTTGLVEVAMTSFVPHLPAFIGVCMYLGLYVEPWGFVLLFLFPSVLWMPASFCLLTCHRVFCLDFCRIFHLGSILCCPSN